MIAAPQNKRPKGPEPHGYHSAVEIDEDVGSWRDWVGPGLAMLFTVGAILMIALTANGTL